jgi:hypothetical protein
MSSDDITSKHVVYDFSCSKGLKVSSMLYRHLFKLATCLDAWFLSFLSIWLNNRSSLLTLSRLFLMLGFWLSRLMNF